MSLLLGIADTSTVTVTPAVQSIVSSISAPLIKLGAIITAIAQIATASVQAPTVAINQIINPPAQSIIATAQPPTILTGASISPSAQIITSSLPTPAIISITGNLVSSWPQNNSWNDAWGTNHITAYGATFNASGKINQCGQFDGIDDYGDAGQDSSLKPTSALTLVTWGMYTGAGTGSLPGYICCNAGADVSTGYFLCRVASTNKVRFYVWTGAAWVYAESNSALTQDQWYLLIGRWDGGATNEVALWIDDVKQTTTATAASISYAANTALEFGVYNRQGGAPSWGAVRTDSSLLYSIAKSTDDMTALWNSGVGTELISGVLVTPSVQIITSSLPTPVIIGNASISPSAQAAAISIQPPAIQTGALVSPSAQAGIFSLPPPTIITSGVLVAPSVQSIVCTLQSPNITTGASISPSAQAAAISIQPPAIQTGALVSPSAQAGIFSLPPPTIITSGVLVAPSVQSIVCTLQSPNITTGASISPSAQAITCTIQTPSVGAPPLIRIADRQVFTLDTGTRLFYYDKLRRIFIKDTERREL